MSRDEGWKEAEKKGMDVRDLHVQELGKSSDGCDCR